VNTHDARTAVEAAFAEVAPDVEAAELTDDARLRQDLGIDSLDFLRLVQTIAGSTGVDTPEADYRRLDTVGGVIAYVAAHGR
jgi:acyl carrier protein